MKRHEDCVTDEDINYAADLMLELEKYDQERNKIIISSKIEILAKNECSVKSRILLKNPNFGQKSKFCSKI